MSQELFDELSHEFLTSSSTMVFTQLGLSRFADSANIRPTASNPDPLMTISQDAPTTPGARIDARWRLSDLNGAIDTNGWLREWLTHAWITLIFARWENYYRPEFARLEGVELNKISSDVMGDLRHLRHDIAHHNGVVSKDHGVKCKTVTRFNVGDKIILSPDEIRLLRDSLEVVVDRE
ncbi:hypothetical protein [Brevibacterium sediminis]|uniref:RiboL-PSP-HEPN domain-containing protein n=1 Tax=Brevibacterium sediminis TaxID=1857024 RepID=A0ABQ1LSJ6_9MICO|nr:hypothetical protein [Brevibacterium sediminis]GGC28277.1 hypothetical protein GCM10010974_08510 [Brevibacterium sediminis]